jgi:hypothetical protein
VVYMNLQQSVVDMPVMALQFSVLLAFMVYVYQGCTDESQPVESPQRDTKSKQPAAVASH